MKLLLILAMITQVHVKGHVNKKTGTYVMPHERSMANSTQRDNCSTKGNTNPYTGKKGSKRAKK